MTDKCHDDFKKGDTITFETGEYSDRSHCGPFRVLKGFSRESVANAFRKTWEKGCEEGYDCPDGDDFIAWMAREGYVEDVDHALVWHVGSYGRFEP